MGLATDEKPGSPQLIRHVGCCYRNKMPIAAHHKNIVQRLGDNDFIDVIARAGQEVRDEGLDKPWCLVPTNRHTMRVKMPPAQLGRPHTAYPATGQTRSSSPG